MGISDWSSDVCSSDLLDQRFHSLTAWDLHEGRSVEMGPDDCRFSYRNSFFKQAEPGRWLITAVRLRLPKAWQPVLGYPDLRQHPALQAESVAITAGQIFEAVCEVRRRKLPDPAVLGNAGSFFKKIVRAHVCTPVPNPQLVSRLL